MQVIYPTNCVTAEVTDAQLRALYAFGTDPLVRLLMIASLDGAATGPDGVSGSLGTPADHRIFALQRALADVVVVGASTARAERYSALDGPALVVLSRTARLPSTLSEAPSASGRVFLAACQQAPPENLTAVRRDLGADQVWVLGEDRVDLGALRERLLEHGWHAILLEGGPSVAGQALDAGIVDELSLTIAPQLLAGAHARIANGAALAAAARIKHLLWDQETLLGLWQVQVGKP